MWPGDFLAPRDCGFSPAEYLLQGPNERHSSQTAELIADSKKIPEKITIIMSSSKKQDLI